jgi:hypothetical protein
MNGTQDVGAGYQRLKGSVFRLNTGTGFTTFLSESTSPNKGSTSLVVVRENARRLGDFKVKAWPFQAHPLTCFSTTRQGPTPWCS